MNDKLWMLLALILIALLLTPERQMRRTPSGQTRPAPTRQTNSRPVPTPAKFVF